MPRIPRHLIKESHRCYHIFSRTAGQEFLLGDLEKEYLMKRMKLLSSVYFTKVFSFCVLSNHFHLLVQMGDGEDFSEEEIERRFRIYYGPKREFPREKVDYYRKRWSDLSWYVREIKQGFSCWYNRMNNRKGFFWSGRFESVVVEKEAALLACMAYVDLNPVRANLVDRPDNYRFCGLGYHVQSGNKDGFINLDIMREYAPGESPLLTYRKYVYEVGSIDRPDGKRSIPKAIFEVESETGFSIPKVDLLRYRSRYFTESVVLGSRGFVKSIYGKLQPFMRARKDRDPIKVQGSRSLYSLRRLMED